MASIEETYALALVSVPDRKMIAQAIMAVESGKACEVGSRIGKFLVKARRERYAERLAVAKAEAEAEVEAKK
jgi:hypothetical protein